MEFKELNLHPDLQRGIAEAEYITCMPVQEQVLANAFGGQDLYVQSQTGTGKTAAFLIVIFQRLLTEPLLNGKKAIIMVPTRELAVQVEEEAKVLGKYLPFKIGSFYGGVGYSAQQQLLKDNVHLLVGTPGRVLDLNQSGQMNLMEIAFLVLDEADRMFDMGFYPDLRKLIRLVPPADRRQTMLFSATLNTWVKNLAWEYTKSPFEIEIAPETVIVDEIEQIIYHVPSEDKMKLLLGIMERDRPESAIIFCNTKRYTEIVAKRLQINGFICEFIIGDLPQSKRLKIIDDIKAGMIKYLVATDVAARGLDIEGLALVVNYDLPVESENYVHRIGRTARAGRTGKAITLASEQDVYELPAIEKYIGKKIPSEIAPKELYTQDKSEGMQIAVEIYDDHRQGNRREGRVSQPQNTRRRNSDQSNKRTNPEQRPRRRKQEDRQPLRKGISTGKLPEAGDIDLSHLSFEERMAYYKEKYEGRKSSGTAKVRVPAAEGAQVGQRRRERTRYDKQGRGSGSGKSRPNERYRRETPARSADQHNSPVPVTPAPPAADAGAGAAPKALSPEMTAAAEKKGVFSRIMGLFKKKTDSEHV